WCTLTRKRVVHFNPQNDSELMFNAKNLESEFEHTPRKSSFAKKSKCCKYNQARPGGKLRGFSIPNPVFFYRLIKIINQHWMELEQLSNSKISLTKQNFSKSNQRALRHCVDWSDRLTHKLRKQKLSRYLLKADISLFFPSIYTHCIPWAIHTKDDAKQKTNDKSLWGNKIDAALRHLDDNQSVGIPIGPVVSRMLSEVILSRVDEQIANQNGTRCIDDYEFGCDSLEEAEQTLSQLRNALSEYELRLNDHKTKIIELPTPIMAEWQMLVRLLYQPNPKPLDESGLAIDSQDQTLLDLTEDVLLGPISLSQLEAFINHAILLSKKYPDERVLPEALNVLRKANIQNEAIETCIYFAFQTAVTDFSALKEAIGVIIKQKSVNEAAVEFDDLKRLVDSVCDNASSHQCHDAIAHSLWLSLLLDVKITKRSASLISKYPNSITACLLMLCNEAGLVEEGASFGPLESVIEDADLYGEHWLFTYEAVKNRWLNYTDAQQSVLEDPCFNRFYQSNVSFVQKDAKEIFLSKIDEMKQDDSKALRWNPSSLESFDFGGSDEDDE
ncbi:MAG: RNA-directed DNA polymerase, partial [Opitutales bacterium]